MTKIIFEKKNIFYFLKVNRLNFDMHVVRNSRSHSDNFGPVLTAKNLPKPTKVGFGSRALHIVSDQPTDDCGPAQLHGVEGVPNCPVV